MLSQSDIQAIFNPLQTVENRIRQRIPTLFEEDVEDNRFEQYKWDFNGYVSDILESEPWPQQTDIADAYILALRQQHEKDDFEKGLIPLDDLDYWQPGQVIENWISIDAGNTSGKCVAASEYITLSDGQRIKAGQLIGRKFELLTLKDGKVIPVQAEAEFNAIESVYKITTSKGRQIVRNAQHPLWVAVRSDKVWRGQVRLGMAWQGKVWALLFAEWLRFDKAGSGRIAWGSAWYGQVWRDWLRVDVVWYVAFRQVKVRASLFRSGYDRVCDGLPRSGRALHGEARCDPFEVVVRRSETRRGGVRRYGARCGSACLGAVRYGLSFFVERLRNALVRCGAVGRSKQWFGEARYGKVGYGFSSAVGLRYGQMGHGIARQGWVRFASGAVRSIQGMV